VSAAREHGCDHQRVEQVRIDKWLWAARFFKTRGTATEAVLGGRVQLNGASVKPSKEIHVDDTIDVRIGFRQWTIVVTGIADKRGSASVAATLYSETPESVEKRERLAAERRLSQPLGADLGVRPTKQDRRRIEALRRAQRRARPPDR
jgi:ribosome-associated heat shock protein Hsp15